VGDQRRQEILDIALALADEGGLGAVTMRAVAQRLGVTAMALYPHVESKDDLLEGLVGRVLAQLPIPDTSLPWQERLRQIGTMTRALARRHPAAVPLIFTKPSVTTDGLRVVDAIYTALLDAGVPPDQVARTERLVSTFVLGYAISEASGRFGTGTLGTRERRGQVALDDLPAHAKLGSLLDVAGSWDAEFDADLADLSTLIESIARS
jgi:AcrR family transcriptional regulator